MKPVIGILVVVGIIFGIWKTWEYWDRVNKEREASVAEAVDLSDSTRFDGLPSQLEQPLAKVKDNPAAFKQWLDTYRPMIKDPRLGAIELDYVVLISGSDPIEAKRMYAAVKKRIPPDSRLYKRIQALQKTYE